MIPIRILFYLNILLYTFCVASCANDGGGSQNDKMTEKVDVGLVGIDDPPNDYFKQIRNGESDAKNEISIKKPFKMEFFAHFFDADFNPKMRTIKYKYSYSYRVCELIDEKRDKSKIPDDFFPRLMIKQLFPSINSCEFKPGTILVNSESSFRLDPSHQTGINLPKDKQFFMLINIGEEKGKDDAENDYVLSSLWAMNATSLIKNVKVALTGVHVQEDDYFKEIKHEDFDKKEISIKKPFKIEYFAHFFEVKLNKKTRELTFTYLYSFKVCELINKQSNKSKIPDDFFPRLMVKQLFPNIDSCEFKAGSVFPISESTLRLNSDHQTGNVSPKDEEFYMLMNIGKEDGKDDPENGYVISTVWDINSGRKSTKSRK